MNGCKKCPAYAKCTETYRGSGCAALRWTYGLEDDPEKDRIGMTDREKLAELIGDAPVWRNASKGEACTQIADFLLANGVTFATSTNVGVKTNMYDTEEIHHNCTVQILTNGVTGEKSIGWWPDDMPPKEVKND